MKRTQQKSAISLISYDADYLLKSIPSYYKYVDEIVLGLDESRISWSRNSFSFDEENIWTELQKLDTKDKIKVVEHNFHRSSVPIENDTHERNFLKEQCANDWIFSFDADEILINAKQFFEDYFPIVESYNNIELMFTWFLVYKEFDEGYLVIADENRNNIFKKDVQGFSARKNLHTYTYCRWTNANKKVLSPLAILHYSFCRPQKDLRTKINNFGHSAESKKDPFYETQKQVNLTNYKSLINFKTSNMGPQWPTLKFIPRDEFTEYLNEQAGKVYE